MGGQGEKEVKRGQETRGGRKGVGGATVGFKFYLFFFDRSITAGKPQSEHPGFIIPDEIWQAATRIR